MGNESIRILVVDDEETIREELRLYLSRKGYDCFPSSNGAQALQLHQENSFDLIVSDINMPVLDGLSLLQHVSGKQDSPLVILVTGRGDNAGIRAALRAGAYDYLLKPVDLTELSRSIQNAVSAILLRRRVTQAQLNLEEEKRKTDRLLGAILPDSVAQELKEFRRVTPVRFAGATVLFTDFEGFTEASERLAPEDLVEKLNFYFSRFDGFMKANNMERLKTIGDAYMCVGGVPIPNCSHTLDACTTALAMREFIGSLDPGSADKKTWAIRIGIHTGPLIAGVVGAYRFSYDVWGDTVNTAARMEAHSLPGEINVTQSVFDVMRRYFIFEERPAANVKGKGLMNMFFLKSFRPQYADSGSDALPNDRLREELFHLREKSPKSFEA